MIIVGHIANKMYLPTELFLAMSFTFSLLMYHSARISHLEDLVLNLFLRYPRLAIAFGKNSYSLYFVCFLNKFIEVKVKSKENF
jgi:hypothetical protein